MGFRIHYLGGNRSFLNLSFSLRLLVEEKYRLPNQRATVGYHTLSGCGNVDGGEHVLGRLSA